MCGNDQFLGGIGKGSASPDLTGGEVTSGKFIGWAEIGGAKMEEGVTIAKVPDWMRLKPEMMPHLIREHEKLGRTLTEEETVTLLRSLGFEISEAK